MIQFWFLHDATQVCLLSRIGTVVAADVSRETLGMCTLYQNRITDMIQVRRTAGLYLTNCNSKDTEDQYHVTREFELCDGGYNW